MKKKVIAVLSAAVVLAVGTVIFAVAEYNSAEVAVQCPSGCNSGDTISAVLEFGSKHIKPMSAEITVTATGFEIVDAVSENTCNLSENGSVYTLTVSAQDGNSFADGEKLADLYIKAAGAGDGTLEFKTKLICENGKERTVKSKAEVKIYEENGVYVKGANPLDVYSGGSEKLLLSNGATDCKWESSNERAVTVDENGVATAVGLGASVITASGDGYTASTEVETYIEGECGENLVWRLQNGVLSIKGSGSMFNYTPTAPAPWNAYSEYIGSVVLDGVEHIGSYAFYGCAYLSWVDIPKGVVSIGEWAFSACPDIAINCYEGSYAQQFAVKNSIKYNNYTLRGDTRLRGELPDMADAMAVYGALGTPQSQNGFDINGDGEANPADLVILCDKIMTQKEYSELPASFKTVNGLRYGCDSDGRIVTLAGVDVSKYQKTIDWGELKRAGVQFAFIRVGYRGCTEGGLIDDDCFEQNVKNAQAAGVPFGVYFFTQAVNVQEAVEEADYVISKLEGLSVKMPIAFDIEDLDYDGKRTENMTNDDRTQVTLAFCERVREKGYYPIIYSNLNYLSDSLDYEKLSGIDIWLANYSETTLHTDYSLWQYSNSGLLGGVSTAVDLNLSLVNYPVFLKNYGWR